MSFLVVCFFSCSVNLLLPGFGRVTVEIAGICSCSCEDELVRAS